MLMLGVVSGSWRHMGHDMGHEQMGQMTGWFHVTMTSCTRTPMTDVRLMSCRSMRDKHIGDSDRCTRVTARHRLSHQAHSAGGINHM